MTELTLKECGTTDDAYRQLAVSIVAQAFEDYYDWMIKPDYEKEEAVFKKLLDDSKRICIDITNTAMFCKNMTDQGKYLETWKEYLLKHLALVRKSRKTNMEITNKDKYFCVGYEKQIRSCKNLDELAIMADRLRGRVSALATYIKRKNDLRKGEGERLKRFFHSETFYLYTGGKVDPDSALAEVERQARRA